MAEDNYLSPGSKGLQKPQEVSEVNGQCINSPVYPEMGGFTGPGKASENNRFNIVPPGNVRS